MTNELNFPVCSAERPCPSNMLNPGLWAHPDRKAVGDYFKCVHCGRPFTFARERDFTPIEMP